MISMLEVLKASKGLPVSDFYAAMWGKQIADKYTIAELEGALPLTFNANGEALIDYRIYGNTVQSGTPTPENPIMPIGCGELETTGARTGQYKLPILSNSTVTNIYLGEAETTRRIKKLVLTGNESGWGKSQVRTGSFYLYNPEVFTCIPRFGCCNVAQNVQSLSDYNYGKMYAETPYTINLWLFDTNLSTDDFKNYLRQQYAAGTPVTVWYVLDEPETAVVNEPLMKIGDYADTVSMEQAGVSIPTNKGSTVIDYDGTLKPSEMYIKYLGVKND